MGRERKGNKRRERKEVEGEGRGGEEPALAIKIVAAALTRGDENTGS